MFHQGVGRNPSTSESMHRAARDVEFPRLTRPFTIGVYAVAPSG